MMRSEARRIKTKSKVPSIDELSAFGNHGCAPGPRLAAELRSPSLEAGFSHSDLEYLPSPRAPFAKDTRSARNSPRSANGVFLHDAPSSSSLVTPQSPSPSITPSLASSIDSTTRRGMFGRRGAQRPLVSPPENSVVSSARVASMLIPTAPPAPLRGRGSYYEATSVPPNKLQRKKSSASLLYQGMSRGLSRVGSVMKRNPNAQQGSGQHQRQLAGPDGDGNFHSLPSRIHSRPLENHLMNVCEAEEGEEEGQSLEDDTLSQFPPPVKPIPIPSPVTPMHPSHDRSDPGVSLPFNVKHQLHVTAELEGLPVEWVEMLKAQGMTESELLIMNTAQRRQRHIPLHPIVRTRTPIDTSRPPSPQEERQSPTRSTRTGSGLQPPPWPLPEPPICPLVGPEQSPAPSPSSRAPTTPVAPEYAPAARPTSPNTPPARALPPTPPPKDIRARSDAPPIVFSTPPKRARVKASTPPSVRAAITPDTGGGLQRKQSLIGRLLDDLDARSTRSGKRASVAPSLETIPPAIEYAPTPSFREHAPSAESSPLPDRRLSHDLQEFRELSITTDDSWAEDLFTKWNDGNPFTRSHDGLRVSSVSPKRIPQPVPTPETSLTAIAASPLPSPGAISAIPASPLPSPRAISAISEHSIPPILIRQRSVDSIPRDVPDSIRKDSDSIFSFRMRRHSTSSSDDYDLRASMYAPPPPPRPIRQVATPEPPMIRAPRLRTSFESFGVKREQDSGSSSPFHSPSEESHSIHEQGIHSTSQSGSSFALVTPSESENTLRASLLSELSPQADEVKRFSSLPLPPLPSPRPSDRLSRQPSFSSVHEEHDEDAEDMTFYYSTAPCPGCNNGLGLSLSVGEHTCNRATSALSSRSQTLSVCSEVSRESHNSTGASLSRMSSVASTVSYHLHEATVQRAYARVLRRVAETSEDKIEYGEFEERADVKAIMHERRF